MNTDPSEKPPDRDNYLRRRAEEALDGKPVDLAGLRTEDIQYLIDPHNEGQYHSE